VVGRTSGDVWVQLDPETGRVRYPHRGFTGTAC